MRGLAILGLALLGGGVLMAGAVGIDVIVHRAAADAAMLEVATGFVLVGAILAWLARAGMREVLAGDEGPRTVATITHIDKAALQDPQAEPAYVIQFRYEDALHGQRTASAALPQTEAFRYRPGDTGIVQYAMHGTGTAVWLGGITPRHDDDERTARAVDTPPAPPPSRATLANRSAELKDGIAGSVFVLFATVPTVALWLAWRRGMPWLALVVSFVFALALWQAVRNIRAAIHDIARSSALLRDGVPAQAVITRVLERPRYMGMTTSITWSAWAVEYTYADRDGRKRHGTSEATTAEARRLRIGDRVAVHYDPVAPKASVLVG